MPTAMLVKSTMLALIKNSLWAVGPAFLFAVMLAAGVGFVKPAFACHQSTPAIHDRAAVCGSESSPRFLSAEGLPCQLVGICARFGERDENGNREARVSYVCPRPTGDAARIQYRPCSLGDAEHSAQIDRVNFATCVANSYRNTTNYPRGVSFTATSDAYCTGTTPPPSLQPRPAVVVVVVLIRGMAAVAVVAAVAAVVVARLPLLG